MLPLLYHNPAYLTSLNAESSGTEKAGVTLRILRTGKPYIQLKEQAEEYSPYRRERHTEKSKSKLTLSAVSAGESNESTVTFS